MVAPLELFAACQPGLESLLARELQVLGADGRALAGRGAGAVCSRGGNAAAWGRGSVRAGGCGRVDGVARRG